MAGRSRITSRPPFSCFKRSTTLRLRTRSQVISTAGLFSGMHGLLGLALNVMAKQTCGVRVESDATSSQARDVRSGEADADGWREPSHPPATGTTHLCGG